jgi:hypothetical protein
MFLPTFRRTGEDELVPGGHMGIVREILITTFPLAACLCRTRNYDSSLAVWEIHPSDEAGAKRTLSWRRQRAAIPAGKNQ